uniref:PDZ domain containing 3 n=1 Tax=Strix occidentalis caurina TaxID=311401 RepID=A0A8D0KVD4_STROC
GVTAANPRSLQGPAHGLCPHADGEGVGEPRFYLLSKGNTETFGFCLHEELGCQGHVIRQVELGGLAQRRGLQDGDRLLQVNGHFVDHMDHRRVVQKIKASGNQVLLAVLDGDSYEAAKALGRDLSQMLPADIRPRLCHIMRDKSGFGFGVSGTKGTFQLSVQQDGPAERAGVPPGSWLLELNGASVRSYSHAQLARKLKQSGSKVTLLVATSAVEEFYRLRGLRVMAALADTSWLPFKVRELHMVKGPAGYGFLLKEDDCSSGATGQFLWDVDAGLPAEQAGMKEGDRLLAVNGESIEGLDHQQTVLRIRAHDDQVTLLVIDPAGDEFYQSVGFGDLVWSRPGWGALGCCEAGWWDGCLEGAAWSPGHRGQAERPLNLPMGQGWNVVGWVDACCSQCPHCVLAEPTPGGAEEAAPGVLEAQEHPASGQAPPHSTLTQTTSSSTVLPAWLPGEHSAAQHGRCTHSCCVSMPTTGLTASHLPETHLH